MKKSTDVMKKMQEDCINGIPCFNRAELLKNEHKCTRGN